MSTPTAGEELRSAGRGGGIDVRWLMPEEFFELPMDARDEDDAAERLLDLAAEVLPGAALELQIEWAAMCAANFGDLLEAQVRYAGFCIAEVEGTRCTATVNASLLDLDVPAGVVPVDFLASLLRDLGLGEVSEISLPCGPAVSCIGSRRAEVDGALTQSGTVEKFWTSFIQVQIPLTNGTAIVMEMSTPTTAGWDAFSTMFAGIVKGIRLFDAGGMPVVMPG